MATVTYPKPPRLTANPAPVRPALSVRRTSSIDVSWPNGTQGDRLFVGRARDYRTDSSGRPGEVLAQAWMEATLTEDKTITAISADPAPEKLKQLVEERGGNHLRLVVRELMPELIEQCAPLYLALDDISGTALVSSFAWMQWNPEFAERVRKEMAQAEGGSLMADRVNICWGLQEGNSGLDPNGPRDGVATADAGDLRNPEDPEGWHELPENDGPGFRRARRIDVTRDEAAGVIRIDTAFQDSAKRKEGGRIAIHEYRVQATVDIETHTLLTLEPEARILPFPECPGAIRNTLGLVGSSIAAVREEVLAQLRGPKGCTHLNDAMRALAEVPRLAAYLEGR